MDIPACTRANSDKYYVRDDEATCELIELQQNGTVSKLLGVYLFGLLHVQRQKVFPFTKIFFQLNGLQWI